MPLQILFAVVDLYVLNWQFFADVQSELLDVLLLLGPEGVLFEGQGIFEAAT